MARYEYLDMDDYGDYIVDRAKVKLLYKSNMENSKDLSAILLDLFNDACNIIVKWRKLKDNDEFLSQKWDTEITEYVVNAYNRLDDEMLNDTTKNGIHKNYRITPEAKLKTSIPQVI